MNSAGSVSQSGPADSNNPAPVYVLLSILMAGILGFLYVFSGSAIWQDNLSTADTLVQEFPEVTESVRQPASADDLVADEAAADSSNNPGVDTVPQSGAQAAETAVIALAGTGQSLEPAPAIATETAPRLDAEASSGAGPENTAESTSTVEPVAPPPEPVMTSENRVLAENQFKDCDMCPVMVIIPAGSFRMGDITGAGRSNERPVHNVTFTNDFALGVNEVTVEEYGRFAEATGSFNPGNNAARPDMPISGVSWNDIQQYIQWLNSESGLTFRLPTEAEWEYAARGKTESDFFWGNNVGNANSHCLACGGNFEQAAPVMNFQPNQFGLYDMHGNVWEWVQDCYSENYADALSNGNAWQTDNCFRVLRGGGWDSPGVNSRSSSRSASHPDIRYPASGFRLARSR